MFIPVQGQEMKLDLPAHAVREKGVNASFLRLRTGEGNLITDSTSSNTNLMWKHYHRDTQKLCLIWPARLTIKLTMTKGRVSGKSG